MAQAKPLRLEKVDQQFLEAQDRRSRALWQDAIRYMLRDRLTMLAIILLAFLSLISFVGAPVASRLLDIDYSKTNTPNQFQPPNFAPIYETTWSGIGAEGLRNHETNIATTLPFQAETEYTGKWGGHILGTDHVGRDQFVRLLYGGQVSLLIAIITSVLSLILGVALGLLGGYLGGILDDVLVWFITTVNSVPGIFLLIVTASLFGQDPRTLVLILVFYGWLLPCRLVRGEVISLKQREYILAARAVGAPRIRILAVHLLPNVFYVAVVSLSIHAGTLILIEAGLSFLGLGVAEPQPTWGNMLSKSRTFFTRGQYLVYWPGIMISMTVLSLYLLGDGIRDALDPRTSRR